MGSQDQTKVKQALEELNRLQPSEQLEAVKLLQERRIKKSYVKYFKPWSEQAAALKKFTKDIKVLGLLGGNRSGKTILGAFICVAWCLGKDYFQGEPAWEWVKDLPIPKGPVNVWVVGVDFPTLRDVIWHEKLRYGKTHPAFLPDDPSVIANVKDNDFQIFFKNGTILTGKSAEAGREKFQGASVDLIWIDEECEKQVYDECYQRTIDCSGKILLTQTPLTDINSGVKDPWVFDLYEDWLAGNKNLEFCQLSMLNSPFISDKDKEEARNKWAGDPEEDARLYGKFVRRSGLVYSLWSNTVHLVKPFAVPQYWSRIVSIDPAATGITAGLWIAVNPEGDYFAFREYYERERTVSEHAKSLMMLVSGEPVDYWLLDPYWGGQRNAETHKDGAQLYREAGIPVRLPDVGKEGYAVNVSREYINATVTPGSRHPKFYCFEGLPHFLHEITHYTYDMFTKGEQRGLSKEKPRKRNDHLMNAMQYAMCLRLKGGKGKVRKRLEAQDAEWFELFSEDQNKRNSNSSYT